MTPFFFASQCFVIELFVFIAGTWLSLYFCHIWQMPSLTVFYWRHRSSGQIGKATNAVHMGKQVRPWQISWALYNAHIGGTFLGREKVDSYKKVETCDASLNHAVCVTDMKSRQIAANYCKKLKTATHDMWVIEIRICVQLSSHCSNFFTALLTYLWLGCVNKCEFISWRSSRTAVFDGSYTHSICVDWAVLVTV